MLPLSDFHVAVKHLALWHSVLLKPVCTLYVSYCVNLLDYMFTHCFGDLWFIFFLATIIVIYWSEDVR
jgi:hypothetical protein